MVGRKRTPINIKLKEGSAIHKNANRTMILVNLPSTLSVFMLIGFSFYQPQIAIDDVFCEANLCVVGRKRTSMNIKLKEDYEVVLYIRMLTGQ